MKSFMVLKKMLAEIGTFYCENCKKELKSKDEIERCWAYDHTIHNKGTITVSEEQIKQ